VLEPVTGTDWEAAAPRLVLDPLDLAATSTSGEGQTIMAGTIVEGETTIATDSGSYRALETVAGSAEASGSAGSMFAVELGIDQDPDRLSVTAAALLLLTYLAGLGVAAAWLLCRRDL